MWCGRGAAVVFGKRRKPAGPRGRAAGARTRGKAKQPDLYELEGGCAVVMNRMGGEKRGREAGRTGERTDPSKGDRIELPLADASSPEKISISSLAPTAFLEAHGTNPSTFGQVFDDEW